MGQRYVREFSPVQVMGAQRAALGLTQRQLLAQLHTRLRLEVSRGTVNRILAGTQPIKRAALASPDVLAGILIILEIKDLSEVGLTPEDAPMVHRTLQGHWALNNGGYSPPTRAGQQRLDRVA